VLSRIEGERELNATLPISSYRVRVHIATNPQNVSRCPDLAAARWTARVLAALLGGPFLACSSASSNPSGNGGSSAAGSTAAGAAAGGRASSGAAGTSASLGGSSSGSGSGGSGAGAGAGAGAGGGSAGGIGASGSSSTGGALGGSSGHVDAAGAGGGGGAAIGTGCAGKAYKLCEDFETGTVGELPAGWTLQKSYGALSKENAALATDAFHWGKMSLRADDLGKSGAARALRSLAPLGATAGKHWGRIFYKVQEAATKPSGFMQNTWVTLAAAEGTNQVVDTVENAQGKHQFLYLRSDNGCGFGSSYDWTFDSAWHCAEWYVDGPASKYQFFYDSTEVKMQNFPGENACFKAANGFTGVIVGSLTYITPPGRRVVWFDDLAIDDNRIGCN
jgi:hypothetical protein